MHTCSHSPTCRKKKSLGTKIREHSSKISWLLTLLLLAGVWHLHTHRKSLHKELDAHKQEKEGLKQHVSQLDEHIRAKTRELSEVNRAQREVTHSVREVRRGGGRVVVLIMCFGEDAARLTSVPSHSLFSLNCSTRPGRSAWRGSTASARTCWRRQSTG